MNWAGIATLVGAIVVLIGAVNSFVRERSTLRQLERVTAIVTALEAGSVARRQMEAIQNYLAAKFYNRALIASYGSGAGWGFISAIAVLSVALVLLASGIAERAHILPPSSSSGTYILSGAVAEVVGIGFLLYAFGRLRASRGPRRPAFRIKDSK